MLPTAMTQANPKYVMGKPMLTVDTLQQVSKSCVEIHNYYINNYKKKQDIIVSFKEELFLVGNSIILISRSDLYDVLKLDALDISLMHFHIVSLQKLASSLYILNICVICV
jgi:hypothetical protein